MTYNRRFVLICMALLLSVSATYAQSGCSATKTYSGKFSLNNMAGGYVNNKDWLDGAATYQYRDASDGSRIFDGDFEFTKLRVSAKGRFYNNCQDGKWEWHYGNGVKSEIIFRNKKPNGKFKVYSPNKTALYIQGEIFEGLLQNEFVYVNEKVRVSGKFDVGKPVGVWVYNSDRYPSAKAVYDGLAGKAASSHSHAISDVTDLQDELDAKADSSDLATVATSGSYADLSNKPTLSDLGGVVTVEKQATADSNYTATYVVKQNGTQVGSKINIPKDYLVKSATLETVGATPSEEESAAGLNTGDKYILFIVNTQESDDPTDLILPVNDLIDTYNADNSTLELNSQNNTFSIKNGGVTRAKLATAVTDELDSKLEASDIDVSFDTTTGILTIEVGETSGE